MQIKYSSLIIFFNLTFTHNPARAQFLKKLNPLLFKSIIHKKASLGFGYGFGFASTQFNEINQRLQELEIGQLTDLQANFPFYIYLEGNNGLGISFDGNAGISPEKEVYKSETYLDFQTRAFGLTLHIPIIYSNRIGIWATGGIRTNNMYFQYNYNTIASANFSNLLTNPATQNNSINLISSSNKMAAFGGKWQYRFWRKDKVKPYEIRIGLHSEYNFSYSQEPWRERRSKAIITNMPNIDPKNLSFNLTISFLGTLKGN